MKGPTPLLILYLIGAAVAIGAGVAINSVLLIAAGVALGVIGLVLLLRYRRRNLVETPDKRIR